MSNHVDVPASGATPAPEWTRSTSGASIRRVMVTSVVTVLVAAAVTATSVYLIADEAPTTGVFRDPDYAAAQAAEQQLVDGIDPATDLADILRFGAAGAASASRGRRAAAGRRNRSGNQPGGHPQVRDGVGAVSASDDRLPGADGLRHRSCHQRAGSPRARDRPCSGRLPSHRGAGPGDRPIDGRAGRSRVERSRRGRRPGALVLERAQRALTSSKPGGRRGCGFGRTLGASCYPPRCRGCS